MSKMLSTRGAFGQALLELGEENPNVIVFTADIATSTRTRFFAEKHPDRFFDVGIAEQNMISMAAGAASCGKSFLLLHSLSLPLSEFVIK